MRKNCLLTGKLFIFFLGINELNIIRLSILELKPGVQSTLSRNNQFSLDFFNSKCRVLSEVDLRFCGRTRGANCI